MNAKQAKYAAARASYETTWAELMRLDRDWTDAETAAYDNLTKEYHKATDELIEWAMADLKAKNPVQFAQIEGLNKATSRNVVRRKQLAEICFRYSGK